MCDDNCSNLQELEGGTQQTLHSMHPTSELVGMSHRVLEVSDCHVLLHGANDSILHYQGLYSW